MSDHPTTSPSVSELFEAYVTAQSVLDNVLQDREVEVPIKDRANPGQYKGKYKYRYATLPGILNHIRGALTGNGIWYTQFIRDGEMITKLIHKSGEWMDTGHIPMPDIKGDPQTIGAIISYFKRYSLTEAMGLAADDDDGETGDREVSFKARGEAKPESGAKPPVEEPPMGWGDWARGLLGLIPERKTEEELNQLRDANLDWIQGCATFDAKMSRDIRDAFRARRQVISDTPF